MSNVDGITLRDPVPPNAALARLRIGVARASRALMASRRIAIGTLIAVMIVWGSTFVVTKAAITELPPLTLAFMRVTIGALVLLPFALPRLREVGNLPWKWLWPMGCIGVALFYVTFNASLALTTAAQGALVQSSIPAVSAAVAILWLRERTTPMRLVGIVLSVVGVLVVFAGGRAGTAAPAPMLGNLLMFAAVLCWGVYTAMAKRVAQYDSIVITTFMSAIGALLLAPSAALELWRDGLPQPGLNAWLSAVYLGVFASGVAYLLYNYSLKHLAASQAGVFTNLIPIVGVLTGVVALGEPLAWQAILGGAIVMIGVALTTKG